MKKRIEWIDSLRGLAMFFVILGHAFVNRKDLIRNYIYSFHMPLFFFVSGLTYKDKEMPFLEYLKKKARGLLLPYFCVNVFVLLIKFIMSLGLEMYKNIDLGASFVAFLKGYGNDLPCIQSWFILTLLVVDFIFYILKRVCKSDRSLTLGVGIIFIIGVIISNIKFSFIIPWHADTALVAVLYYYFGYMFMKYLDKYKVMLESKWSYLLILVLFPLAFYIQFINGRVSMNANNYHNIVFFVASSMITIISLVIFVNLVMKKDKLFMGVGLNSMFYLGYHAFILSFVKKYIPVMLSNSYLTILTAFLDLIIIYPIGIVVSKYVPIMIGKLPKKKV